MRHITAEQLKTIIDNHQHWLNKDVEGWETMKADLSDTNLSSADLSFTNLNGANLSNADLRYANLSGADLSYAYLRYANLRCANLSGAELKRADLYDAVLHLANLRSANLRNADLRNADLNLANLINADLNYANLSNTKNIPFTPISCPDTGSFIGWKKACIIPTFEDDLDNIEVIVKLQITEDAKRTSSNTRKCRCSKAIVLDIQDLKGNTLNVSHASSIYDNDFIYKVGEIIEVDDFDDNRWNECSKGIHFFINRNEAVMYEFS